MLSTSRKHSDRPEALVFGFRDDNSPVTELQETEILGHSERIRLSENRGSVGSWNLNRERVFETNQLVIGVSLHMIGTANEFYIFTCRIGGGICILRYDLHTWINRGGRMKIGSMAICEILDAFEDIGLDFPSNFIIFRTVDDQASISAMINAESFGMEEMIRGFYLLLNKEYLFIMCVVTRGVAEWAHFILLGNDGIETSYYVMHRDPNWDLRELEWLAISLSDRSGYPEVCSISIAVGIITSIVRIITLLEDIITLCINKQLENDQLTCIEPALDLDRQTK